MALSRDERLAQTEARTKERLGTERKRLAKVQAAQRYLKTKSFWFQVKRKRLAKVQAAQREEARKALAKRQLLVGKLASNAGLFIWPDTTLAGLFAVLAAFVLAAVLSTHWFTLNCTSSVPLGLYRRTAVPQPLLRGALVILPVPASVQAFHSRWLPLLKPVAAVAGETVCTIADELWVDHIPYGPVYAEAHGMPLPHLEGCLTVSDGHVFLASRAPRSLDSRYFGAVSIADLSNATTPLFTLR